MIKTIKAVREVKASQYDDKDKEYAAERNKLIPKAESYANAICGNQNSGGSEEERIAWNAKWTRTFLGEMDRLYAAIPRPCPICGRMLK